MKLKYIIASLLAGITLFSACEKEADHYLDEIKVDKSFLGFPQAGGSLTISLTATENWTISISEKDAGWLSVSPASGQAGSTNVTFTAAATEDGNNTSVTINCAGKKQIIKITQEAGEKPEPAVMSVAEALAIIKTLETGEVASGTYRVKGKVCKINEISVQYGNATFYLSDDGSFNGKDKSDCNWLQVYRGLWLDGEPFTKGDEFSVGDELVVEGLLMDYKGTPETKEKMAHVVSVTKSLISVEPFDFEKLPAIDTTFNMVVTAKESPLLLTSDSDWLQIVGVSADGSYKLHANENPRTAERTATVSIQGPTALKTVSITQSGIPASGATVSEIIEMEDGSAVLTLQSTTVVAKSTRGVVVTDGSKYLYIFGDKTADVQVGDNVQVAATKTTYGGIPELTDVESVVVDSQGNPVNHPDPKDITNNAVDYKSAVTEYVKLSGTLKVSGNYYNLALDGVDEGVKMGSVSYPITDLNIKSYEGKKITVTGYFTGLTSTGGRYINIVATKIAEYTENPKGTLTNPYTPSEIATLLTAGTAVEGNVYVKGKVSAILYTFSANFGTGTFWISDDGNAYGVSDDKKKTSQPTKDFECYGVYWFNNTPWAEGNAQVAIGDEVVVCGKVTVYNGIAETSNKNAWVYSVNGSTTDANGVGNAAFPFNVAGACSFIEYMEEAKAAAAAADQPAPSFPDVCVKGKVSAILYTFSASYGTGTFWISDDGTAYGVSDDKKKTSQPTKDFECYGVYWFNNTPWAEGNAQIAVGDDVIVRGQLTKYNGIYETANKKAWVYSLNGNTE